MSTQPAVRGTIVQNTLAGNFRIMARPPRRAPVDITTFRGSPTKLVSVSFTDPFGPEALSIQLPQVTLFDALGRGDLEWVAKGVSIDVIWEGDIPASYQFGRRVRQGVDPQWRWEGYIVSPGRSATGLTLQAKGSLLQLDDYLAKPEYAGRPMPYEWAISRQFRTKPALRLNPLKIIWPDWWPHTYVPPAHATPSWMIPAGVTEGEKWSALLTRETGSWDPVLTSYIQTLLQAMYSERGRWSIDLDAHRQPVMLHRDFITEPGAATVTIDPISPGNTINLVEDWDQTLTTVYAQGNSLSGVTYTGMQVSSDGSETYYVPLAALRQVYPESSANGWFDDQVMAKEVMVQMQAGLSQDDASIVARAHLARFADAGVSGTIVLGTDPVIAGVPLPRHLVRAGMDLHVPGLFGRPEGVLLHVSKSSWSPVQDKVTLTVDSKFRDQMTVEEVRLRGRDALAVSRLLIAGQYSPPVSDQMLPWNYGAGSGYIPSNDAFSAKPLFDGMPRGVTFPWTEWTTQRPPKDSRWRSCYSRLGRAQSDADRNWVLQDGPGGTGKGIPILMAQAGTIRLVQIAAYDLDGNVMKVPFHVSFYYSWGVNNLSMPMIPVEQVPLFPPYAAGQHYPYVRDGWEEYKVDGTKNHPEIPHPVQSVGLIRAYGTFYEKAGYWPGSYAEGDVPTGMMVDESTWSFDTTGFAASSWDPYNVERNLTNPMAGNIYAMIYCDEQDLNEVFFAGRMFRAEPGQGA